MASRLPLLYALIVILETVALLWKYTHGAPASSAPLSILLGWGGLISMVVMLIYSVARRSKRLRQIARLSYWLEFHIFMGVQGMLLVGFHSSHLFYRSTPLSWLNPGFLSLVSVLIVFSSGIFGRYMYSMLPRSIQGERVEAQEIEVEIRQIAAELPSEVRALFERAKSAQGLLGLVRADIETRSAVRALAGLELSPELKSLAKRRISIERKMVSYQAAEKVFRSWIIAHRPMAAIMYVLAAVHVLLSYMFTPGLSAW